MNPLTSGLFGSVDTFNRLCVPAAALKSVEWWESKTVDVTVELVEFGLARVYLATEAKPLLETMWQALDELSPDRAFAKASDLADRYRPLKLYAGGRLSLTKEVTQNLGFSFGEQPTLFIQPLPKALEVMSLPFRKDRLLRGRDLNSVLTQIHHSP